ncbi:hypothetical protein [Parapedobacter sp.]
MRDDTELIIVGEDDIQFTDDYSETLLLNGINEAKRRDADLLLGGVSWFNFSVKVSSELFWIDLFNGTHFMVIFKKFFGQILEENAINNNALFTVDVKLSHLTQKKMVFHPFICTQREFGYSDVSLSNNEKGYVDKIFQFSKNRLGSLSQVADFYKQINLPIHRVSNEDFKVSSFVFLTDSNQKNATRRSVANEFRNRNEFDLSFIETKNKPEELDWDLFKQVIEKASKDDNDVIVVVFEHHEFAPNYNKSKFFSDIIEAHYLGASIVFGGARSFNNVVSVIDNLYWIDYVDDAPFLIIFKNIFDKIIDFSPSASEKSYFFYNICNLTTHKMLLSPYISIPERDDFLQNPSQHPYASHHKILNVVKTVKQNFAS